MPSWTEGGYQMLPPGYVLKDLCEHCSEEYQTQGAKPHCKWCSDYSEAQGVLPSDDVLSRRFGWPRPCENPHCTRLISTKYKSNNTVVCTRCYQHRAKYGELPTIGEQQPRQRKTQQEPRQRNTERKKPGPKAQPLRQCPHCNEMVNVISKGVCKLCDNYRRIHYVLPDESAIERRNNRRRNRK